LPQEGSEAMILQKGSPKAEEMDTFELQLERTSLTPAVPPVPVFHCALSRVGNQVLLEPGYVDLVELRVEIERAQAAVRPEPAPVKLYIREKYLFGRAALVQLRDAVEQILQSMPE
jgi:hypothetical protein